MKTNYFFSAFVAVIISVFALFLLSSCEVASPVEGPSYDDLLNTSPVTRSDIQEKDFDIDDIEEKIIGILGITRGQQTIKSFKLKNPKNDGLSAYYEVILESSNGDGYAIVSSDFRFREPICYVDRGSLNDTLVIEPLKQFFRSIPDFVLSKRKELDSLSKETPITRTRSVPELIPENSTLIDTYYEYSRDTLLKIVPVEWGQCPPLGSYINYSNGYCSVPAVAQVMAYHKKPYYGYNVSDWNDMISGLNNTAISTIGLQIFNALYWLGNLIPPLPSDVVDFFEDNNYSSDCSSGYSYYSIYQKMQYGPVIVLGFYDDPILHPDTGHYWIADGTTAVEETLVYVYQHNETGIIFEVRGTPYYYWKVHYNWGWAGSSNGWYNGGVFQPSSGSHNYSNYIRLIRVES